MRMLTAVLVGVALFGSAYDARATDPADYYLCAQKCDRGYDACLARSTGKGPEDCPGTLVRCHNTCDPEWRTISKRAPAPQSCWEKCQGGYDACARADDGKHGGSCAKDVMVCRNACPPEEEAPPVASAPPEAADVAPAAPSSAAAPAAAAPVGAAPAAAAPAAGAPVGTAPASSGAAPAAVAPAPAPERVAAPEKASAPASPIDKREAAPNRVPPAGGVANAPRAGAVPPAAAPAGPQGATRAKQPRRNLWARIWCSVAFCGSGATAQKPLSCRDACQQDYDTCFANRDPKRGSGCDADMMRCRQACAAR